MTCPGHPNGGMCWLCAPPGHLPSPAEIEARWARFKALRELGRGMRFQLTESAPDASQPANPLGLPPIFNGRQLEAIEYVAAHPNCRTADVAEHVGASHKGAEGLLKGLFARKVLGRQFSTSGRISHWYYEDGKPAPFLPGKPSAEERRDHLRPVRVTDEPTARKLTPRPVQPPPAPLYTDAELDDYWSEHPKLTRKEAEAAFRREMRRVTV